MDNNIIPSILEELLCTQSAKRTSSPNQIHIRCRYCGDSTNPHSAHLYVGINRKDDTKLGYECKKCSVSGNITEDFLRLYDIDPSKFADYFRGVKTGLKKAYDLNKQMKLSVTIPETILKEDLYKIEYIQKRMEKKITPQDIQDMKIVLNLRQFLNHNKITILDMLPLLENPTLEQIASRNREAERLEDNIEELTKHFFGFLSADNNRITMRNLGSNRLTQKYFIFTISSKLNEAFIYYPRQNVDVCASNPKIIMAEGVFDILNVREHEFKDIQGNDTFFIAVGGVGSYRRALKSVLKMTGFIDAQVIIYSDEDISMDWYRKNLQEFSEYLSFTIIYNTAAKDFGDRNDEWNKKEFKLRWPI